MPLDTDLLNQRTPQSVEIEAQQAAKSCDGVEGISHTAVHFLPAQKLQDDANSDFQKDADKRMDDGVSVLVEMTIEVDQQLTVAQAGLIAANARRKLEALQSIDNADIHLELDDDLGINHARRRIGRVGVT